jgi:hypothetical protein
MALYHTQPRGKWFPVGTIFPARKRESGKAGNGKSESGKTGKQDIGNAGKIWQMKIMV